MKLIVCDNNNKCEMWKLKFPTNRILGRRDRKMLIFIDYNVDGQLSLL